MKTSSPPEHSHMPLEGESPTDFWQRRYVKQRERQRGRAGHLIQAIVAELTPARVLELGCSHGDDSLWLAEQGWQVTAVDISQHAVETAQRLAQEAGLSEQIQFQACDLATSLPAGEFELVCALFFQSPFDDFPRIEILQRAAQQLVSGGHLLIITHASAPPWAPAELHEHVFPTAAGDWEALALPENNWEIVRCEQVKREGKGPDGQTAELEDNVILVKRH